MIVLILPYSNFITQKKLSCSSSDQYQSDQYFSFYKYYNNMEAADLTQQQFEDVLRLCDMLAIEDFNFGIQLLRQSNWNVEAALGMEDSHIPKVTNINPPVLNPPVQTFNYPVNDQEYIDYNYEEVEKDNQNAFEYNQYEYYEKQLERLDQIERKKKNFNEAFVSLPLKKTKSEIRKHHHQYKPIQKQQEFDKKYGLQEQVKIIQKSNNFLAKISQKHPAQARRFEQSQIKRQNNRKFQQYLHRKYETKINFVFGTFMLSLTRSYLQNKYLLVYVHKSQLQQNKSIKLLLRQKEVSTFVNQNFVSFGMFQSSDDYEILHKYVQLKDLPAFLIFNFNKKTLKQNLIGVYPVLQSEPHNFIEWLGQKIGVKVKKILKEETKASIPGQIDDEYVQMKNILFNQNLEYEQMARLHQLKRNKSKLRKESIQAYEMHIQQLKEKFKQKIDEEPGKTINIRFRLPTSGNSLFRVFRLQEKVQLMFQFIHCFGRDEFEQKLADFDLRQSFPPLSLHDKKELAIKEIFQESELENIIVKQL